MELQFKPERLRIIRRLRYLSLTDVNEEMKRISGQTSNFNIDRWESTISKHPMWKIGLLAEATGVPVGFFFFKNVQITMIDMQVEIFIAETLEKVEFNFMNP